MPEKAEGTTPIEHEELTQVLREYGILDEQVANFGPWIIFNHGEREPATFALCTLPGVKVDEKELQAGILLRRMKESLSSVELERLRRKIAEATKPFNLARYPALAVERREHDLIVNTESFSNTDLFRMAFPVMTSPEREPFFNGRSFVQIEMNVPSQR